MRRLVVPSKPLALLVVLIGLGGAGEAFGQAPYGYTPYWRATAPWQEAMSYNRGYHRFDANRHPELRYYQYNYPSQRYFTERERYPHSYRGMFGLMPRDSGLTLRYQQGPGYSPYSRRQLYPHLGYQGEALWPFPQTDGQSPPLMQPAPGIAPAPLPDYDRWTDPSPEAARPAPRPRVPEVLPPVVRHEVPVSEPTEGELRAWMLLGRGRAEHAQFAFSSVALAHPLNMRSKAGFSLSMAFQGDYGNAAFAMRRALQRTSGSLRSVPMNDELERRLLRLIEKLESKDIVSTDSLFMQAAVHYLLRQDTNAASAVEAAIDRGDRKPSTLRLLHMLREANHDGVLPVEPRDWSDSEV